MCSVSTTFRTSPRSTPSKISRWRPSSLPYLLSPSHSPKAYLEYLTALLDYLTDFYHRAQPLADVSALLEESRTAFAKKWAAGEIEGWNLRRTIEAEVEEAKRKRDEAAAARRKAQSDHINDIDEDDDEPEEEEALPDFSSVESIERLGGDKLKEMLKGMGAKCG